MVAKGPVVAGAPPLLHRSATEVGKPLPYYLAGALPGMDARIYMSIYSISFALIMLTCV